MERRTSVGRGDLVYKHEPALFMIGATIGIILWLLLIVGTLGVALIYVLLGFLAYLFVQSAFISYLRGTGVLITEEQFPDLYERVVDCCRRVGVSVPPDAYLIHADGAFNALATRFLGRDFIVLYSDMVDALSDEPEAVNFYIGHELGHIHRKHLQWSPVLWPAGLLPVLGAAYSRAREYTCDTYGAACCDSPAAVVQALAALAAGERRWKTMNPDAYCSQVAATGKFWMSFHELTGDYPWLTKRVARLRDEQRDRVPSRHWFAWTLACFVPRIAGGGASFLIVVAIIGILAAVAIPAYQDYAVRARVTEGLSLASAAKVAVSEFYYQNEAACVSNVECGIAPASELSSNSVRAIRVGDGAAITVEFSSAPIDGGTIVLTPYLDDDGALMWDCQGGTLAAKYRPAACRP